MLILVVLLIAASAYIALEAMSVGRKQVAASLRRAKRYGGYSLREAELSKGVGDRLVGPMAKRLAGVALRMTPKGNIDDVRRKLQAAGMDKITPQTFLAAKCIISGLMFALGMTLLITGARPAPISLLIGVGGGAAFFLMPDSYLTHEAARPQGRDRLAAARRARPADGLRRGRPRLRRRDLQGLRAHGGPADLGVQDRAARDAHRREPRRRP